MSDTPEEQRELARRAIAAADRVRNARRHPITSLLSQLRDVPSAAELDALDLAPAQRRSVEKAAREVVDLRSAGSLKDARDTAWDAAVQIVDGLPSDQQRADYLDAPEPDTTDPAELAARVSRH
jgi:hypothetical protein